MKGIFQTQRATDRAEESESIEKQTNEYCFGLFMRFADNKKNADRIIL